MTLEDRIAELRLGLSLKVVDLDKIIEYAGKHSSSEEEKRNLHGLKIQRADYRFFIKELDMVALEHQMTVDTRPSD